MLIRLFFVLEISRDYLLQVVADKEQINIWLMATAKAQATKKS